MNSSNDENKDNRVGGWPGWLKTGATVAGVAAAVGGLYLLTQTGSATSSQGTVSEEDSESQQSRKTSSTMKGAMNRSSAPPTQSVNNLNSLLADIYVQYIALKKEDFQLHYKVFTVVFGKLHETMKAVDSYYNRYSSNVQFAGSHYDRLRIKKPDEFDMDIVIGLPVNFDVDPLNPSESDIVIEPKYPGYVQLRAGTQYQKILIRDGADSVINRRAHEWLDDRNYILRSKFTDWFKSVGDRALNQFPRYGSLPVCFVDNKPYTIKTSSSGPAWTIKIEALGFNLDVDLVPCFKFSESRWPVASAYRDIPPNCKRGYWMVVPKANKGGENIHDEIRSWRLALQDQEKQLFNGTYQLRQAIRLLKKLRDAQGMNKIASYYIKTIFFWEIIELERTNSQFWERNDIATIFKYMVKKFYDALEKKNIPYFWNKSNNLIENVNDSIINEYKRKLQALLAVLDNPADYKEVAKYLLTLEEYTDYVLKLKN